MASLEHGEFEVSYLDMCKLEKFQGEPMEFAFARLLKDKGLPTVGTLHLRPDPLFHIERIPNLENKSEVFRWRLNDAG